MGTDAALGVRDGAVHVQRWLDAADDFNASVFSSAHGYYRQGIATLRSALEGLAIAASYAHRQDMPGLLGWVNGRLEPPKFGNARDIIAPSLGSEVTAVLKALYKELSGVHSRGAGNWCQLTAGSGGSQGFPAMASRMASSAVMPWAAAVSM